MHRHRTVVCQIHFDDSMSFYVVLCLFPLQLALPEYAEMMIGMLILASGHDVLRNTSR